MLTGLEALALGIVQGATEFLPVSSSGHLKITEQLFHFKPGTEWIPFELACHLGTLFAVLVVFRKDIMPLFSSERFTLLLIAIALVPLFLCYPLLESIKEVSAHPRYIGLFFFATAALLFLGERLCLAPLEAVATRKKQCATAFAIGFFQTLALFPGVSRSGSTMSAARFLGWKRMEAARFSFLLALPTILMGVAYETKQLLIDPTPLHAVSPLCYLIGFAVSFIVGLLALRWLMRHLRKGSLLLFCWYCIALGLFSLILFNTSLLNYA
ncbi:undecaprenyl-diphosphate phosphatase [Simkania negevensis]|uniref:Undecaprenyl-diphosphatase n=1 Tax=Simkania negevensis TaxID=83561 RepID=A0ABS3AQG5_9BACT|nr:undecaprenyl-diphosphate phosphatase [Simkania negevensis]